MIRRILKTVVLSLAPLVVLLLLAEGTLWAVGLGESAERLSLSRGFDRSVPYLVPGDVAGSWRTQMYDNPALETQVPPRDGRRRLLMFGGSNTEGFMEGRLETWLTEADPDPGWEVINLGRRGYGSERVSILFEQAFVLQPDVVLIYMGHNEFMEHAFLQELEDAGSLSWTGRMADTFMNLRLTTWVTETLRPERFDFSGDRRPETRQIGRDDAFFDFAYEDTLRFYEAYGQNLRRMCKLALSKGVSVVLCTVVGNDFELPFVSNHPADLPEEALDAYRRFDVRAGELIPERFNILLTEPIRPRTADWALGLSSTERAARQAQPPQPGRQVAPLRPLTGVLAEEAATTKERTVADALWTDPTLWTSVAFDAVDRMSAVFARDLTEAERADLGVAAGMLREVVALSPDCPSGHFRLGFALYLLGHDEEAATELARAHSLDRAPRRGNDVSNGVVRDLAAELDELVFLDIEALFRSRLPQGLVSYELMCDVCHVHPGGRRVLVRDLLPAVIEAQARRR